MPFRPNNQMPTPADLRSSLNDTKTAQTNNALYQTINGLINLVGELKTGVENSIKKTDKIATSQLDGKISYKVGGTETGIYFPVIYPILNISTPEGPQYYTTWWRMNNTIMVSGKCAPEVTAGAVAAEERTEWEIDLPIISYFLHTEQVSGVWNAYPFDGIGASFAGTFYGRPDLHRAVANGMANNSGKAFDIRFMFSYEFVPYVS